MLGLAVVVVGFAVVVMGFAVVVDGFAVVVVGLAVVVVGFAVVVAVEVGDDVAVDVPVDVIVDVSVVVVFGVHLPKSPTTKALTTLVRRAAILSQSVVSTNKRFSTHLTSPASPNAGVG